jgi:tyrosyl-tRNA synthetase
MDIRMHKFSDKVPEPTLRRLPWYLSNVKLMKERGETYVSSTQISKQINIDASQIAKDLSYVNISGRTRVGYEIDALIVEHEAAPHLRILQKRLAKEVTIMVHSEEDYNAAVDASNILFGNATSDALKKLDEDTLLAVFEGVPQFEVSKDAVAAGVKAVDLFTENAAIFASKGEMRKLVQGGGVSLNKEKLEAFDQVITSADLLDEKYLLVQRGKKNYYLIIAK